MRQRTDFLRQRKPEPPLPAPKLLEWNAFPALSHDRPPVMVTPDGPKANHLLAALPDDAFERWRPHLEPFDMPRGLVLYGPGQALRHVHFPTTSLVSLLFLLENGHSAEVALIGNEGMVGISAFMGGTSTPNQAVVHGAGRGFRMPAHVLLNDFEAHARVAHLLLHFTQALITQVAQSVVCNRHHSVAQQLCRLLLLSIDRLGASEFEMTHELIANMLGVRREGVTEAARALQVAGLIRYSRGHIRILDLDGLDRLSCECYRVIKSEYHRLLSDRAHFRG